MAADAEEIDGLAIQKGAPRTASQLRQRVEELGLPTRKASSFGYGPVVDRSLPVPPTGSGAPIVAAARGLRARRRGEQPLSNGVSHPEAKALLDEIYQQQPRPR